MKYLHKAKRSTPFKKILSVTVALFALFAVLFVLRGTPYAVLLFSAALIHESGHILTAKLFKVKRVRKSGDIFSLSLKYDFSETSFFTEAAVSAAGAVFNAAACVFCIAFGKGASLNGIFFIFSNAALATFNLIPISPLDGFGIMTCLASEILPPDTVAALSRAVSSVFSFAFFILTVYIQFKVGANLSLALLAAFLLLNANFKYGESH